MKPYNEEYSLDILKKYSGLLKQHTINDYILEKQSIRATEIEGYLYRMDKNIQYDRFVLKKSNDIIMALDFKEIEGTYEIIKMARGRVGIAGLGIGYVAVEMAYKEEVSEVIVYETSKEVIEIFNNNFKDSISQDIYKKITVINIDAFEAKGTHFDSFFSDIYGYNLTSKLVEDYRRFNSIHSIDEYSFFGVEGFLLACSYDEIVWVYIPENWMAMSKNIAASLESSRYIDYYIKENSDLVSSILKEFKKVLNEEE